MKRFLAVFVSLVVVFGMAMAQETPYSYSFKGGTGTCLLNGQEFNKVWSTSIKLFMTQNMKGLKWIGAPVTPDAPSKTMSGGWVMGKGITKWACNLSLLFEENNGTITIYAQATSAKISKGNQKNAEKKFFDTLISALYGVPEPEK